MLSKILAVATAPFNAAPLGTAANAAYGGAAPTTNILDYTRNIITVVFSLLGLVFLFLTLYAGYLWMTAMGDSKKVQKAKDILTQSVIGLIIMVLSYGISYYVVGVIGFSGGFGGI